MSAEPAAATPGPVHSRRARYHSADNNFISPWPAVPAQQFLAERDRAFDPAAPDGLIPLDASAALQTAYPATTPVLLLRYLRIRASSSLSTELAASGEILYVIKGAGDSLNGQDRIAWAEGDVFCFPGGGRSRHSAGAADCLLLLATNEPLLALERLRPAERGGAAIEAVHWPWAETADRFTRVWQRPITPETTGHAVLLSSAAMAPTTNCLPSLNVAFNSLEAGRDQRPHRHNGVAVTYVIQGQGVHSEVEGRRIDWSDGAVQVTPPAALHSHHNRGSERMLCLIFQDEALHYYTRTPGFSFD